MLDVDAFYPSNERFTLATKLNAVLASPGFEQWLEGSRSIRDGCSTARRASRGSRSSPSRTWTRPHRMFFVSLLLNEIVAWMRRQSGTSSLRAIVYMDEIAGYFPPVANPPPKAPLLTLLKQGRAFGVGVVLATQNTGGSRLQGPREHRHVVPRAPADRARQGARARRARGRGGRIARSRRAADTALSALGKRVFLLHDVHAGGPMTFQSRWAMSYLRGPLSRDQIRALHRRGRRSHATRKPRSERTHRESSSRTDPDQHGSRRRQPAESVGIGADPRAGRVSSASSRSAAANPHYTPVALGIARVTFADAKLKVNETRDVVAVVAIGSGPVPVDWAAAPRCSTSRRPSWSRRRSRARRFDPVPKPADGREELRRVAEVVRRLDCADRRRSTCIAMPI